MDVLDRGDDWIALHKPAGFHVHPPENGEHPPPRSKVCLYLARSLVGRRVYPVHRLDVGTSGVLLMALSPEGASKLGRQFQDRRVKKVYHAAVRGWLDEEGRIDLPLELDSTGDLVEASTAFRCLARIELNAAVGKRHPTARYSLVELVPHTGRFHQLRRHLNRVSHPILGDCEHGDSHHNRYFREALGIDGLCLRATRLSFDDPTCGTAREITLGDTEKWLKIKSLFGL